MHFLFTQPNRSEQCVHVSTSLTQSQGHGQPAKDEQYPSVGGDVSNTLIASQRVVVTATRKQHHARGQKGANLNTSTKHFLSEGC